MTRRLAVLLAVALSLDGCALYYPRDQIGFWDQHVAVTAWGGTWITPYGPINFGYLSWQRNIVEPQMPAPPPSPTKATVP